MTKSFFSFTALALAGAFGFAQNYPDAEQTVPDRMGWMQGFPPAREKTLKASDNSFFEFPALRYSVNHIREFYPTRAVSAGNGKKYTVKTRLDPAIDNITFTPWDAQEPMTFEQSLAANYTDGIIIMHKGKIVYEKYPAGLKPDGLHAAMSVSKSFTGTVASILVAEKKLDPSKKVTDYIPELKNSGFADATVGQVMDMTTAIKYGEDYNDPNSEVWAYSAAGNVFRPDSYSGPQNYYEYLATVKKLPDAEHGTTFGYKTVNTELLAWICSRVTGKGLTDMVSEMIWQPLGAHYDGYYQLDPSGIAFAGGGFDLNLRDMALFGEMLRNGGKLNGKQVIPAQAALDIAKGGSSDSYKEAFAKSGEYPKLKGWSYHNMWWITNNSHGAYMARGVHGQAIYIDPAAQMVIARFASTYYASNKYIDPLSIPAYEAVADYLMKK
ncbi:serine hydrolase [uncultured Treponema sp.]|uniref:serine hydrolase domain-containing protein n=1 Tax=uncultured Treponema sp. TaxID=162155 RepID=UPI0015B877D7|nr:serine hydrolase [uncultured Treponema sp.]